MATRVARYAVTGWPNNTTVSTSTSIQFRRAGQQGPTRTLTDGTNVCIVCRPMLGYFYILLRYDKRCYFDVRSKADMSRLNLPHG